MTPPTLVGDVTAVGLPRLSALLSEMREESIDPSSATGERTLDLWFGAPTDQACAARGCGNRLRRFEVLNGSIAGHQPECWPCTEARLRRIAAAAAERPRLAR